MKKIKINPAQIVRPLEHSNSPYAEFSKTLTPSPSPIKGEGNKKTNLAPLLPAWEKRLGDEGLSLLCVR